MLVHYQLRENIAIIRITKITGASQHNRPGCHPLPEPILRVTFQPPLAGIRTIMGEVGCQHLRPTHNPEKLYLIAQLHVVVRGRRSRAGQSIRYISEHLNDLRSDLAHAVFQNAGFIQNHSAEGIRVEMIQHFVVRDIDSSLYIVLCAAQCRRIPEFLCFPLCLLSNSQRGDNQRGHPGMFAHGPTELQLLNRFPVSAVLKKSSPAFAKCPSGNILLPFKHHGIHPLFWHFKPARRRNPLLAA